MNLGTESTNTCYFVSPEVASIMKEFQDREWMHEFNTAIVQRIALDYRTIGNLARTIMADPEATSTNSSRIMASLNTIMDKLTSAPETLRATLAPKLDSLDTKLSSVEKLEDMLGHMELRLAANHLHNASSMKQDIVNVVKSHIFDAMSMMNSSLTDHVKRLDCAGLTADVVDGIKTSLDGYAADVLSKICDKMENDAALTETRSSLERTLNNFIGATGEKLNRVDAGFSDTKKIIESMERNVSDLAQHAQRRTNNSCVKGGESEREVFELLQDRLFSDDGYTVFHVGGTVSRGCDILVRKEGGYKDLRIEVKDYSRTVPTAEVDKFMRDIDQVHRSHGMMISLHSKIAKRRERVGIDFLSDNRCAVYIGGAGTNTESNIDVIVGYIHAIFKIEAILAANNDQGYAVLSESAVKEMKNKIIEHAQRITNLRLISKSLATEIKLLSEFNVGFGHIISGTATTAVGMAAGVATDVEVASGGGPK